MADRALAARGCSVTGCRNRHRARGLCSTHYNQRLITPDVRHPRTSKACEVCGRVVEREARERYRTTCSMTCRAALASGAGHEVYDWTADAMSRARRAGASLVEAVDRAVVLERDGGRCYLCDVVLTTEDDYAGTRATVDHVKPLSAGGHHTYKNCRAACLSCNSRKGRAFLA